MTRTFALILLIGIVGGCVTSREEVLKNQFDSWLGAPVSNYALRMGPPQSTFEMGPNKRAFQWATHGQSPGVAMPMGGSVVMLPPQQTTCQISLVATTTSPKPALADWFIENWSYNGQC